MAQITSKELTALEDLIGQENTLAAKYGFYAQKTADKALADCYTQLEQRHRSHAEQLFGQLK